jgi:uncharacterized protein (TIGR00369 family)
LLEEQERLPDGIRSRVKLRPELTNSWGGAHGGLIVTLLDASMTVAARYTFDPDGKIDVATIDLTTSFIGQAKETLICDAKVAARRGSTVYAKAKAVSETGDLVAYAIATLRAIGN